MSHTDAPLYFTDLIRADARRWWVDILPKIGCPSGRPMNIQRWEPDAMHLCSLTPSDLVESTRSPKFVRTGHNTFL
jgi:hypothetical protein